MTSQEKDKFICEKLGVCWHEEDCHWNAGNEHIESLRFQCSCKRSPFDIRGFTVHCKKENPDFTSEVGRVQLLKLMMKGDCVRFTEHFGMICYPSSFTFNKETIYYIDSDYITDDTGLFRDEAFKWLGGEE